MLYKNDKLKLKIQVHDDKSVTISTSADILVLTWKEFWSLLSLMNDAAKEVKF